MLKFSHSRRSIPLFALMLMAVSCGPDDTSGGSVSPVPPVVGQAETTQQFIDRTMKAAGSFDLSTNDSKVVFEGCLRKNKTEDPRTVGAAAFLTNLTASEYRLVEFSYVMDTSGIRPGESAETDVGFTVLPKNELVALNSGEELMITHRYDTAPNDRGISKLALPQGGLVIGPDQRLSIGSVSAIFPLDGSGAQVIDDTRLADGSLFRVCYSATLQRADTLKLPAVRSYRSAFRDRSYVADPARTSAPFTAFRNMSNHAVKVYGIGSFISNLSSTQPSTHSVDVLINGTVVKQLTLPEHVPGRNSAPMNMIDPVDLNLAPGDVLTVKGRVFPQKALVFDYAAFILADDGLESVNEQLDILKVDLNDDGYNDIIDLDSTGSFWVSIRVGQGLQNTQQEWARGFTSVTKLAQLPRASQAAPLVLQATNANGLCINLTARPQSAEFLPEYCQTDGSQSVPSDIWGDFNGDGFPDRLRVDANGRSYMVALGSPSGLGAQQIWAAGYGAVDKIFVSDANGDGRSDAMAQWSDITGPQCRIFFGEGDHFRVANCP